MRRIFNEIYKKKNIYLYRYNSPPSLSHASSSSALGKLSSGGSTSSSAATKRSTAKDYYPSSSRYKDTSPITKSSAGATSSSAFSRLKYSNLNSVSAYYKPLLRSFKRNNNLEKVSCFYDGSALMMLIVAFFVF